MRGYDDYAAGAERAAVRRVFAQRLRVAMAVCDRSGRQLATAIGVSAMAVCKWTSGAACPESSKLMAICAELGCSVDWLMSPDPVDVCTSSPRHTDAVMRSALEEIAAASARALDKVRRAEIAAARAERREREREDA